MKGPMPNCYPLSSMNSMPTNNFRQLSEKFRPKDKRKWEIETSITEIEDTILAILGTESPSEKDSEQEIGNSREIEETRTPRKET